MHDFYTCICTDVLFVLPYGRRVRGEHADNLKELLMKTFLLTSTCLNYFHIMHGHIQGQYFQHSLRTGQSPFSILGNASRFILRLTDRTQPNIGCHKVSKSYQKMFR